MPKKDDWSKSSSENWRRGGAARYSRSTRKSTIPRHGCSRFSPAKASARRSCVPTWAPKSEAWYARQVRQGIQVVICHPKLVETGLDLLDFPTIIFYESGYSLHTLRQASRRSWRIGQRRPVRVLFLC